MAGLTGACANSFPVVTSCRDLVVAAASIRPLMAGVAQAIASNSRALNGNTSWVLPRTRKKESIADLMVAAGE
jgi:hypothetical protein